MCSSGSACFFCCLWHSELGPDDVRCMLVNRTFRTPIQRRGACWQSISKARQAGVQHCTWRVVDESWTSRGPASAACANSGRFTFFRQRPTHPLQPVFLFKACTCAVSCRSSTGCHECGCHTTLAEFRALVLHHGEPL